MGSKSEYIMETFAISAKKYNAVKAKFDANFVKKEISMNWGNL